MRIEKNLRRMAEAFSKVVIEQGMLEICRRDIEKIKNFLVQSASARQFLFSENIKPENKKKVISRALESEFSPYIIGLIGAIVDLGFERKLFRILTYIEKLLEREEAAAVAEVYSAVPLDETLRKEIKKFSYSVSGREIKIIERIDDSILGGLILKIGDRLYDGSVVNRLKRFKKAVSERI